MTMLKELDKYENLGTPKFFCELFNQLNHAQEAWTRDHVKGYFYNRIVDNQSVFDGCLSFAEVIGAVTINENGFISLNPSLAPSLVNEKYLANKLLNMALETAKRDEIFYEIFSPKNISYDIVYKLIQIDRASFPFRFANFRKLLTDFGFLYLHPDKNIKKYIINSKYRKLFDQELRPEIQRRKLGIEELETLLEQRQIYGEEAENFAFVYEKKRLAAHPGLGNIEIVSAYDIGAGYDIVSYADIQSTELNRFVEVKSFSGVPSFHWSRNEMDVARMKRDSYFLYLIDRDKMTDSEYSPTMISNPYELIINNEEWLKRVEGYFIMKK